MMSSWISVAVWMNSMTAPYVTSSSPSWPRRRAVSSSRAGRTRLPPPWVMYSPAWWMNGTSESRCWRKTASVASSLSATRSTKRPARTDLAALASSGVASRRGGFCTSGSWYRSWGGYGSEGHDLLQAAIAEAVDAAALEVPPGILDMIGVLQALHPVRPAHLRVRPLLVGAAHHGEELVQRVQELRVLDDRGHYHGAARQE